MILLRMDTWERIRADFTAAEKLELNLAVAGEAVCPSGAFIHEELLPAELREKLRRALQPQRAAVGGPIQ
ncbi:MAG TPA: hypothetical protein VFQ79_24600 [Bryobacteraceae bacterium]|nr:hypothetical protein [Bryobacteraceae bacterium]